ncbi:uncharacterized protein TrAtP1_007669 [Trichoderma atroviride]|uniref:uncharacterized protein n=1 Tax=Hypocrea atroviridis TaxID=63577 RepID=UPI0033292D1F|nr:hypothetical protein TrAtP1_007669 [Trichoderma atroviride]
MSSKELKDYVCRNISWYHASNTAYGISLNDPGDNEGPDAALFLGTLIFMEPYNENKLPRNWKKFAAKHPRHIQKIRKAASRFIMMESSSQLHIDLAPDTAKVKKKKKNLVFREMTEAEQCESGDKTRKTRKAGKARKAASKRRRSLVPIILFFCPLHVLSMRR